MTKDLLIEIGTEELPPLSLNELAGAFAREIGAGFAAHGVAHGATSSYCTPRRLAVLVADVEVRQPERDIVRRGPSVAAAFGADGHPTKALVGFARSCGVSPEELAREDSDKGAWMIFRAVESGAPTALLIPRIVEAALVGLPIKKWMRWGSGDAQFVRPVHWICLVFGDETVPAEMLGVHAGGDTFGHRFHAPGALPITQPLRYAALLRERGFVEPSFEMRRAIIVDQIGQLATSRGVAVDLPDPLLNEVTALVEWPRAILGSFDEAFLALPAEVLIETMQRNQKYFPVRNAADQLRAEFVAICNIDSKKPEEVRKGNERVLRPRFADAKFFWDQDRRRPLSDYFPKLEGLVFQDRLGSVADRSRRVAELAKGLAGSLGVDPVSAERAALLAKCDLVTSLVGEFPGLQGIMGRYYAQHAGESDEVSTAIGEQYLPRHAKDALPNTRLGFTLALADRLDLLIAIFGIGHRPTGTKDPYGLRRASIAIVRILVEAHLDLDLKALLERGVGYFQPEALSSGTAEVVLEYIWARLEGYYLEQDIRPDTVEAVVAAGGTVITQLDRRIRAVHAFRDSADGVSLAAANKRISNILTRAEAGTWRARQPNPGLFAEPIEQRLWERVCGLDSVIGPLIQQQDFVGVLSRLAELREDIDCFFGQVLVMCEDELVRQNRLAIMECVRALFLNVADISLLRSGSVSG